MKNKEIINDVEFKELVEHFGAKLYNLRIQKNLTVIEVAKKIKTSPGYLSKIENGVVCFTIPLLYKLAFLYDFEPSEFIKPI
jgi:transcriptional regulator with XRE-family HTH domain